MSSVVLMRPAKPGPEQQPEVLAGPSWYGDEPFGAGVFPLSDRDALIAADAAVTSSRVTSETRPMWLVVGR